MSLRDDIRASLEDWETRNPHGYFDLDELEPDLAKGLRLVPLREIHAKQTFYSRQRAALLKGHPHLARVYSPHRHVDRLFALYDAFLSAATTEIASRSRGGQLSEDGRAENQVQEHGQPRKRMGFVPPGAFTHSPDYRSVTLRGEGFSLTSQQAQVIEILHEAHKSGNAEIGSGYIFERLGKSSTSERLRDLFKGNLEAWNALIRKGKRKGTYRLDLDEK